MSDNGSTDTTLQEADEGAWFLGFESFTDAQHHGLHHEDIGWMRIAGLGINPFRRASRREIVQHSRVIASMDSNCKLIIRLWVEFSIGTGVKWTAEDDRINTELNKFWRNPENKRVLSNAGQRKSARKQLTDGEIFFAFFGTKADDMVIRRIDTLQITDIAVDPEDAETPRFFKRVRLIGNTEKVEWLADWMNEDNQPGVVPGTDVKIEKASPDTPRVFWVPFEDNDQRGEPLLSSSLPWCAAHRQFMRSRIAIQQALARFPQKLKVKGGLTAVNSERAKLESSQTQGGSVGESNPPHAPGSTWVENLAASLENLKMETGAAAAKVDGAMLLQLIGAGAGIYPHYLGSGESFRLATAKAMESPMRKQFDAYAGEWEDIYGAILRWVADQSGIDLTDVKLEVIAPDVFPQDATAYTKSVAEAVKTFPDFVDAETLKLNTLSVLRVSEPKEQLEVLGSEHERRDRNANETQVNVVNALKEAIVETQNEENEDD